MEASNEDLIGRVLDGKYKILELLGQGGMGTVYKALHVFLQTIVVVKVVKTDPKLWSINGQAIEREARLLSTLRHPNIIKIYDGGASDDLSYLAMEHVEGPSLQQILVEGRPIAVDYAIEIVRQVGSGLDYAHSNTILHRDIKPSNILIGKDGRVVLTDFGLALVAGQSTLTRVGTVLGTPTYMSPEQARGVRLDARSDIYSLGVVLFELLTGQPPFRSKTPSETFARLIKETPPSPREFNRAVPFSVEQIVLKAIATNPDERYQTAREFVEDLTNETETASGNLFSMGELATKGPIEATLSSPILSTGEAAPATGEFAAHRSSIPDTAHADGRLRASMVVPTPAWIPIGILFLVLLVFVVVFQTWRPTLLIPAVIILMTAGVVIWMLVGNRRTSKSQVTTLSNESTNGRATAIISESRNERRTVLLGESSNSQEAAIIDEPTLASYPYRESPVASTIINREASVMALLQVLNGPQRGRHFRLADSVIVGRGSHCDVALNDPTVSRTHAEVFLKDSRFHVYDLGSHGGIFVNELQVAEQELRDRDEIRIGDTILMFIQVISPDDQTADAKRRVREFDVIWKELSRVVRRD